MGYAHVISKYTNKIGELEHIQKVFVYAVISYYVLVYI